MPGRAQAVREKRVADAAQLVLRLPAATVDDDRAEPVRAEASVLVGLRSTQAVVDMQRADAVAELAKHVPGTGRVRPAGDEHRHLACRRDQLARADERLDAAPKLSRFHGPNCR